MTPTVHLASPPRDPLMNHLLIPFGLEAGNPSRRYTANYTTGAENPHCTLPRLSNSQLLNDDNFAFLDSSLIANSSPLSGLQNSPH